MLLLGGGEGVGEGAGKVVEAEGMLSDGEGASGVRAGGGRSSCSRARFCKFRRRLATCSGSSRSPFGGDPGTGVPGDAGVAGRVLIGEPVYGVPRREGTGVTGNFSRVGSMSVKKMSIPFARVTSRRMCDCRLPMLLGANRPKTMSCLRSRDVAPA